MTDDKGVDLALAVIATVGCIGTLLALSDREVPWWGVALGVVVVVLALGVIVWRVMRRGQSSTPTVHDNPVADGLRSIEALFARLGNASTPEERNPTAGPNSRSIAAAVFGNRVRNEDITQTGPGDTHVVLRISGSPIPPTHVGELLRMYQARYDRGSVDLTITSDDDSVSVRTDP